VPQRQVLTLASELENDPYLAAVAPMLPFRQNIYLSLPDLLILFHIKKQSFNVSVFLYSECQSSNLSSANELHSPIFPMCMPTSFY
jgi:hypothetical protein